MKATVYVFATVIVVNFIFAMVTVAIGCSNLQTHNRDFSVHIGIINLLLDLAVIAIPMPSLYKLQLRLEKKLCVMAIFMLGFL